MTEPMEVSTNASGRRVANGSYRKEVRPAVVSSAAHLAPDFPSTQKVYAIIGPDGSGKTTIARVIAARLAEAGIRTRIAWMRSPRIVTLGLTSGLDEGFLDFPHGRLLLDLAKKHGGVLVIASPEELLRRRPILSLDPRLPRRLRLYAELAARFGLGTVDSGNTSESLSASKAAEYLGIPAE